MLDLGKNNNFIETIKEKLLLNQLQKGNILHDLY